MCMSEFVFVSVRVLGWDRERGIARYVCMWDCDFFKFLASPRQTLGIAKCLGYPVAPQRDAPSGMPDWGVLAGWRSMSRSPDGQTTYPDYLFVFFFILFFYPIVIFFVSLSTWKFLELNAIKKWSTIHLFSFLEAMLFRLANWKKKVTWCPMETVVKFNSYA